MMPRMNFLPARSSLVLLCLLAGCASPTPHASSSRASGNGPSQATVESAVSRVKPSLVKIEVIATQYGQGREVKTESSGSGVIITKQGHIITNHHVAGRAVRLNVILSTNEEIEAELVGTDPLTDLAVIKLKTDGKREFPCVAFGDSDKIAVGQPVLAMGSPLAMSQSVTRGIISNTKMIFPRFVPELRMEGENVGALVRWITHDAAIFPGNSGGPLVNLRGEIIGINEIGFGLSGAIPGNLAQNVANQIVQQGFVSRSWLGTEVQPVLKSMGMPRGVLVATVIDGSPSSRAGIQAGDVLMQLAGQTVDVHHNEQMPVFNQLVAAIPVGKKVDAVVWRNGKKLTLTLTTEAREPARGDQVELRMWGITASEISMAIAKELRLSSREGVMVTSLMASGPAGEAKPSLMPGDIIRMFNHDPVRDIAALQAMTAKVLEKAAAPVPVLVVFDRKREQIVTVVSVGIKETNNVGRETRKAWLPVSVQAVSRELAQAMGNADLAGVRVTQVMSNTTAAAAGLRVGDIIMAVDGEPVRALRPGEEEVFWAALRMIPVGSKPEIKVLRETQTITLAPELVRAPVPERELARYDDPHFEFSARDLSFFDQMREGWDDPQNGALVTEIKPGGWAAIGRLSPGDVIVEVGGEPINDVSTLENVFKKLASQKPPVVVLRVKRGIHGRYVEIEPTWDNIASIQPSSTPEKKQ
jgi:serine protease Do